MTLSDVIVVPMLARGLLSVKALTKRDSTVEFGESGGLIKKGSLRIPFGSSGQLYSLKCSLVDGEKSKKEAALVAENRDLRAEIRALGLKEKAWMEEQMRNLGELRIRSPAEIAARKWEQSLLREEPSEVQGVVPREVKQAGARKSHGESERAFEAQLSAARKKSEGCSGMGAQGIGTAVICSSWGS